MLMIIKSGITSCFLLLIVWGNDAKSCVPCVQAARKTADDTLLIAK